MGHTMRPSSQRVASIRARLSLNSGIETADSADFTDFEGVIEGRTYESLRGKVHGIDNRNRLT